MACAATATQPEPADERDIIQGVDGRTAVEAMGRRRNNRLMRWQADYADIEEAAKHKTSEQSGCEKGPDGNESDSRHAAAVYAVLIESR